MSDRRTQRQHRVPTVISWFDTPGGRYLMLREDDWLSVAPADSARISHRLNEALSAATA